MPFQSEKQRRYLHANHPEIANRWEAKYGLGGIAELNSQLNSLPEYYMNSYPAAHGGLIPSHEAGIYGLAEGGQLVKPGPGRPGYGGPHETEAAGKASDSRSGGEHHGDVAHGPGGRFAAANQPSTTPSYDDSGEDDKAASYVNWNIQEKYKGTEDLEEQREIDKRNALTKLRYDPNLTKDERETLEVGLGLREPKKRKTIGNYAVDLLTTALTGGIKNPVTAYAANKIIKYGANQIGFDDMITTFVDENINFNNLSMDNMKLKIDQKKAEKDADQKIINALPEGHPERIQKEGLKEPSYDERNVEITMDVEKVNDANAEKTQLLEKYEEMDQASRLAWQRQRDMQSKKEAYYKMFRDTYMSAQGGRVPSGYNTGGLSNLFRLKNV